MAQRAVEQVVQGFQHAMDAIRQQKEFERQEALREKEAEDLKAYRESELAHQGAILDAQTAQNEAINKANERLYNLQKLPITQQISEQYGKTGALPAGASVVPDFIQNIPLSQVQSGSLGLPQVQQPSPFQTGTINLPGDLGTIPGALSPEAYAQRQRILKAPEEEAEAKKQQTQYDYLLRNAIVLADEAQANKVKNDATAHTNAMALESQRGANQIAVANVNYNRALEVEKMRHSLSLTPSITLRIGPDGLPDFNMADPYNAADNYLKLGWDGQMSMEQLKNAVPNPKERELITSAAGRMGFEFPTEKQLQSFQDLQKVSASLPDLKHLHDLRNDHWFALAYPSIGQLDPDSRNAVADFDSTSQRIKGAMPLYIKVLAGMNRYNTAEAEKRAEALIPGTAIPGTRASTERDKLYQFTEHDLQDAFDYNLGRLPPAQQKNFLTKMNMPDLRNVKVAPGVEHPVGPGNIDIRTGRPGGVPDSYLHVWDSVTKKEGYVDPGQFNREKGRFTIIEEKK